MDPSVLAPARHGATLEKIAAQRRRLSALLLLALVAWVLVLVGLVGSHRHASVLSGIGAALLLALLLYGGWRLDRLLRNAATGIAARRVRDLQYRTLADNLPDPLVRFDREGRHLYANPRVEDATGLPPEAFIGKTNAELGMPAENVAAWRAVLQRVLASGRSERLEFSFLGPSGLRDWESIVVPEPAVDGQPATALVISRDITDRLASARALQSSELRYRLASSFGQVWDWDIERNELRLPAAYWDLLGFPPVDGHLTLEQMEAAMHPEDRPRLRAGIRAHLVRHEPYALEFRIVDTQGRERWFQTQGQAVWNEKGRATYMAGTTFEITERKAGELALRIKDAAFESSLGGIALAGLDGRLSYVNPAFCRLWGRPAAELIGRSPAEFWRRPEDAQAAMGHLAEQGFWTGEFEAVRADGNVIIVDVSAITVRGDSGRALCMMGTFVDVTHRRDAEAALRRMNVELEQRVLERTAELAISLSRLKSVNRELETFTYSVSHDLKAPLRGIDGYSRLLLRDHETRLDEEGRVFLANIRQATQHMGRLIDDLLAYSRLERRSLDLGPLDLAALVQTVLSAFADELRAHHMQVQVDLSPGLRAWGDAQGLTIALRNLVENALKFTRDARPPTLTISATGSGGAVTLHVQDNGMGFDMKFHDRIFDIFQRLHRAEDYPGTGVGLAIVRKAMERMGGRTWADSRPGEGATFHLQLPESPTP